MATILTVEDEENIRRLLAVNLQARGHEVLEARSAEEGLPLLSTKPVDLVLLDIRLPGQSGWSMLEAMQQQPDLRDIPVIVVSGEADRPYYQPDCQQSNVKGIVPKPVALPVLLQTIQRAINDIC
ncbi:MAG TPA: response regulator [Aggregatilineales bacterium]|nr:response regulator [Chloroflexota bacterium]HOA23986.1 response regulator [Aggregatilineales bacterium]HPV07421.1 response regulator [Aggregatilineales bacterium]HQE20079.1 response regulator [Aggregatilineales bacterium]